MSFDLIIFDCDGVLVDSERLANQAFANILNKECGLSLTLDDMFERFVGHSLQQCLQIVEQMTGQPAPAHLESRYQTEINRALEQSVEAVSGIESVLQTLTIPYCVASSGSYIKMGVTLGRTGLLKYVKGRLYSTSDVARGKPHPDIYLYVADHMGVIDPSRCLVIEDSPLGVQGAVAAGMTVFGYSELMDKQRLLDAGAHHTFDSMNRLLADISSFTKG